MADSVETLGVDLRTRLKQKKKQERVRFSLLKKNKAFHKNFFEGGGEEVAEDGPGASESVGSACSGNGAHREVKIEKESTSLSLFMVVYGLEVEEELSTMATQAWAEGVWIGKWLTEQKET